MMKKITLFLMFMSVFFGYAQVPGVAAPTPPVRNAVDVISIFSDVYTNIAGVNTNPSWGQATVSTVIMIGGNNTLSYTNFNYQGTDWAGTPQNISAMEFLHIDIWTNSEAPNVFVISSGPEVAHAITSSPGTWKSVEIPIAGITGDLTNAIQFKFDGGTSGSIYLDNLYFYKSPANPVKDATLSDLKVDGTTILGFGSGTTNYTYEVPSGTTIVPQITTATTTQAGASRVITQASAIPGSATVAVTSSDASTTKTYTVSIVAVGPGTAAPTPPARNAADVKGIFSDAYPSSNVAVDTYDTTWCPGTTTNVMIAGNATKKVTGLGCEGVDFKTGRFDATAFTHFHMDIFTDTPTFNKNFNLKFSNWNGGAAEANAIEYSGTNANFLTDPNPGTWISIDITLASWTPITNASINDLVQFVITSDLGTVYYDNIYLYKGTPLGVEDFTKLSFKVFPNPSKDSWIVKTKNEIMSSIQVFDILGKQVLTLKPNATEAKINASKLRSGLYFAKINTANGSSSLKLVRE